MNLKSLLIEGLGEQSSSDNQLQKQMRLHQSWWRAFVLAEEQGQHPMNPDNQIGSSILNGEKSFSNFIDDFAKQAVKETLQERKSSAKGMISEARLFNNLLSSQPLCFNFFGRLKYNLPLATEVFQTWFSNISEVTGIYFEFVPNTAQNSDNSAHDVAIEFISTDGKKGLIGLECKYTEPFSPKVYSNDTYKSIYNQSTAFLAPYNDLTNTKYNQLFRNQLIIESALINQSYDVGYSGLFCYQEDENALSKGKGFQKMLKNGEERFKIITFADLIENIQKMDIDWETREWTMMLWVRYCGINISTYNKT
jgi:hypothetical protein